jgi:hypothetical protein
MAMPETAVHQNYLATGREDQIWLAGQAGDMKPIAVPEGMHHPSDCQFGFRILRVNSRHDLRALVAIYVVGHSNVPL